MIVIKKIKIGDKLAVSEQCAYCTPGNSEIPVNVGDIGEVVEIELNPAKQSEWPVRVRLEGHPESYLFGLEELDYVD